MKKFAAIFAIVALGSTAFAHSRVTTTTPKNETVLAEMPEVITLTFANKIRLVKIDMTHLDQPAVPLDLGDQKSFATEFIVPVDPMGTGTYQIEWRGLGIDGHAMSGAFMFTVE